MAVTLPIIPINLGPNISKSFYENLAGGTQAVVTVANTAGLSFTLTIVRVDAPVVSYVIPANSVLALEVKGLLLVGVLSSAAGFATGTLTISVAEF